MLSTVSSRIRKYLSFPATRLLDALMLSGQTSKACSWVSGSVFHGWVTPVALARSAPRAGRTCAISQHSPGTRATAVSPPRRLQTHALRFHSASPAPTSRLPLALCGTHWLALVDHRGRREAPGPLRLRGG